MLEQLSRFARELSLQGVNSSYALSAPPALSSRKKGGGREMVMSLRSLAAALSAASLLTPRTSRARKEAQLPATARNHRGPELSAREASRSPTINSAGLNPLIVFLACLSPSIIIGAMLAPRSDKKAGRPRTGGAR